MTCNRCSGLVIENHDEWFCIQCGNRPFETIIAVKCSRENCRAKPEKDGYCIPCWNSRIRSDETREARLEKIRAKERARKRAAKLKQKGQAA